MKSRVNSAGVSEFAVGDITELKLLAPPPREEQNAALCDVGQIRFTGKQRSRQLWNSRDERRAKNLAWCDKIRPEPK